MNLTFEQWYTELRRLAESRNLLWMIGDPEEHRLAYDEGDTPEEELIYQIECAI